MKQKLINIIGFVFIGLNIVAVSTMTYVYYQHQQYKKQRSENNVTYPKSWSNTNHRTCHEDNIWSAFFNKEK